MKFEVGDTVMVKSPRAPWVGEEGTVKKADKVYITVDFGDTLCIFHPAELELVAKETPPAETKAKISDGGLVKVGTFPLEYDPLSGNFYWLEQRGGRSKGDQAGNLNKALGYWQIRYEGVLFYAHRLAFVAMEGDFPDCVVDHVDRDGTNNAWTNLRKATHSENHLNTEAPSNNTSGHKGVYYASREKAWVFKVANEVTSYHKTKEEAVAFKAEWMKDREFYHG